MSYKSAEARREYGRLWQVRKNQKEHDRRVEAGELIHCSRCNQLRSVTHKCVADYATLAPSNQNAEGLAKACAECGRTFTSFMPKNLMWRPQYCSTCLVEKQAERARRLGQLRNQREAEAAGRPYIPMAERSRIAGEKLQFIEAKRQEIKLEHSLQKANERLARAPILEFWPYGATGWPYEDVNSVVPKEIPESRRSDICQELCLMILAGEIQPEEAQFSWKRVARKVYSDWAISIDWRNSDGLSLADMLPDKDSS